MITKIYNEYSDNLKNLLETLNLLHEITNLKENSCFVSVPENIKKYLTEYEPVQVIESDGKNYLYKYTKFDIIQKIINACINEISIYLIKDQKILVDNLDEIIKQYNDGNVKAESAMLYVETNFVALLRYYVTIQKTMALLTESESDAFLTRDLNKYASELTEKIKEMSNKTKPTLFEKYGY